MVLWHGTECTRLRWVCGGLSLGGVPSGNVSAVSLEFLSMFLVLVCVGPDGLSPSPAIL